MDKLSMMCIPNPTNVGFKRRSGARVRKFSSVLHYSESKLNNYKNKKLFGLLSHINPKDKYKISDHVKIIDNSNSIYYYAKYMQKFDREDLKIGDNLWDTSGTHHQP